MPTYKFYYFPARARGELVKLVLAAAGQEFENVVVTMEEWPKYKGEMPFGQIPVLEIDGVKYAQGRAIATYLAEEYGMYGKTSMDHFRIQEMVGLAADMLEKILKPFFVDDKTEKEKVTAQIYAEHYPRFAKFFEERLSKSSSPYFVGDSLTLADLAVYDACENGRMKGPDFFAEYPNLSANFKKVEENPTLAAYIKNRPVTVL